NTDWACRWCYYIQRSCMGRRRQHLSNAIYQAAYRTRKAEAQHQGRPWEEVTIGDCRLICGDARAVLPTLDAVDVIVCDPPYGVDLGVGNDQTRDRTHLGKRGYASYDDTYDNFVAQIVPLLNAYLDKTHCAAVFTGPHIK